MSPGMATDSLSLTLLGNIGPDFLDHKGLQKVWSSSRDQAWKLTQQEAWWTVNGILR